MINTLQQAKVIYKHITNTHIYIYIYIYVDLVI